MQACNLGIAAATLMKMKPNKAIVVDRRLNVFFSLDQSERDLS